ncbi:MAG: hypothetical protein Q8J97_11165, partial [Flavobacteriaceae bacterium]|nr:hypothetical protein [Flavobacteriaceae bacterium]
MRLQREALEKEEKLARLALRQGLDTDGGELMRWHEEHFTPLLRAYRARLEAERLEKERQRLEREAQEREEIRRQARIEAIMQLQAKQRETLQRDQGIVRDKITMEENKEAIQLRDRIAHSFDDALRRQRVRERSQMRATCAKAPSVISFARWHSDRTFAEGSTGAVPVIPESCPLQVKPVKPKFMAAGRAREESVVSIMSASALTMNPSSLPGSPIAGSLSGAG